MLGAAKGGNLEIEPGREFGRHLVRRRGDPRQDRIYKIGRI
jgi:hypothetical protein